jgi:type II secretory pathway predicted ATPase ExeA
MLLVAGGSDNLFAPETFSLIFQTSKGICRMVNKICSNCLIEAFVVGKKRVDTEIVQKIISEIK